MRAGLVKGQALLSPLLALHRGLEGSRTGALAVVLALVALVDLADLATGFEVSCSFFYLFPILAATLYLGRRAGFALSWLCAGVWLWNDHWLGGHPYSSDWIPYWNAAIRLATFLVTVLLLHRVLERAEEQRRAAREMAEVVSLVSHEIRNSLSLVGGATLLLKSQDLSQERQELYALLERGHDVLRRLASSFLERARMESGRLQPRLQEVDLCALAAGCAEQFAPLAERKHVDLVLLECVGIPTALADPDVLFLVLANLVDNALKYTSSGGTVTLRVEIPRAGSGTVRVAVEDTGIGIRPEDRERILAGFYRTPEAERSTRGYGLGLKLCRDLLAMHATRLEIESQPGEGSAFSFELPLFDQVAGDPDLVSRAHS